MQTTEIKGREVLKIQSLAGTHDYAVDKTSPMFGKKYRRFAYLGKAFVANAEDEFCKQFDKGEIYSADLGTNDEGQLSLVGYTDITREVKMAKAEATLTAITEMVALTTEQLAVLEEETTI